MKKILISYNSVGLGHKVIAENIAQALKTFSGIEVVMLDLLEFYSGPLTSTSTAIYKQIIKNFRWLWKIFYTNQFFQALALPLRVPFAALKAKKLQTFLDQEKPDLFLSTHPAPTALMSYLKQKGKYTKPLVVTFSDFHFQPFWVYPAVDRYLVMTVEQKDEVMKRGFASQRIIVTGLPVDSVYGQDFDLPEVLRKFKLLRTKPVVLLMGGSRGWGIKISDVLELLKSSLDFQIVALSSLNQGLYDALQKLAEKHPDNLKIFGNLTSREVAQLFSIAKVLVTKPGGLTIAQALLKNLPMVLVNPLPTMEEMNQAYLARYGVAVGAKDAKTLRTWVERLLQDQKFYAEQKKRMKELYFPKSAEMAARAIIDIL